MTDHSKPKTEADLITALVMANNVLMEESRKNIKDPEFLMINNSIIQLSISAENPGGAIFVRP